MNLRRVRQHRRRGLEVLFDFNRGRQRRARELEILPSRWAADRESAALPLPLAEREHLLDEILGLIGRGENLPRIPASAGDPRILGAEMAVGMTREGCCRKSLH